MVHLASITLKAKVTNKPKIFYQQGFSFFKIILDVEFPLSSFEKTIKTIFENEKISTLEAIIPEQDRPELFNWCKDHVEKEKFYFIYGELFLNCKNIFKRNPVFLISVMNEID